MLSENFTTLYYEKKYEKALEVALKEISNSNYYEGEDVYNLAVVSIKLSQYKQALSYACLSLKYGCNPATNIFHIVNILGRKYVPLNISDAKKELIIADFLAMEKYFKYNDKQTEFEEFSDLLKSYAVPKYTSKIMEIVWDFIDEQANIAENLIQKSQVKPQKNNSSSKRYIEPIKMKQHKITTKDIIEINKETITVYRYSYIDGQLSYFMNNEGEMTDRFIFETVRNTRYFKGKLKKKYPNAEIIEL